MTYRYAEFVVKAPWFAPSNFVGEDMLMTSTDGRVWARYQGEVEFSRAEKEIPSDRLLILAYLEDHGWEIVGMFFSGQTFMLIIARRKVYGTMEVKTNG